MIDFLKFNKVLLLYLLKLEAIHLEILALNQEASNYTKTLATTCKKD